MRRYGRALVLALVVVGGLVAVASTAIDHRDAASLRCWASATPDGGFVMVGC